MATTKEPIVSDHTYHDHRCARLPCAVCCCRIHGNCPDCPKHADRVREARR